jgi:hypothetical protein
MYTRRTLALAAAAFAAVPAHAQELVTFTFSWIEVQAGTTLPVAFPNGVVNEGEGAELRLTVGFTPAVGQPISYTPPPGAGQGTVGGFADMFIDVHASAGHNGYFHHQTRLAGWTIGSNGTIDANGVYAIGAGQFPLPGMTANPANPIENIWRIRWTPNDYTSRIVTFTSAKAAAAGGTGAALYIEYTGNPQDPEYISKQVAGNFGGIQIPVVPSPSAAALIAVGGLAIARRRR